jgi:hypothetical protein
MSEQDRREYFRRYYQENREAILAKRHAYYQANKARIGQRRAAAQRRYWHRIGFLKRLNRLVNRSIARFQ